MIKTRLRSRKAQDTPSAVEKSTTTAKKNLKRAPVPQEAGSEKHEQDKHVTGKVSRKKRSAPVKVAYCDGPKPLSNDQTSSYFSWKPDYWEEALDNIRKMRQDKDAPVDTMGCEKCHDETAPDKVMRYQMLVSLMLSSQTKDEVTHAAVKRLCGLGLTPEYIAAADLNKLEGVIYPVSFYKNKAKHLKKTAEVLLEKYEGDIPSTVDELCRLPGVGPKMAYLAMSCAWKKTVGIGVDTHVHRIANRLQWMPAPTKNPEQTRKALEEWLPRDLWAEVNWLLVGFGQTVCKPVGPKCSMCLNRVICPFASTQKEKGSSS
ncbi:endonuclease III-like protein 1 isoform X2 [Ornithodoros turicata]